MYPPGRTRGMTPSLRGARERGGRRKGPENIEKLPMVPRETVLVPHPQLSPREAIEFPERAEGPRSWTEPRKTARAQPES